MTIRLLRTLVAVSDTKTFSAAAERIQVTHAAVSQQMRALEAELGLTLFDRTKRTPELTPAGHQVVAKARKLVWDYDDLAASVLGDDGLSGMLSVGALRTTLTGLIPKAMADLKGKYPEVGLHIRPGLTRTLLTEVERGVIDTALITKPHLMPQGVRFRALTVEHMELIAAPDEREDDPLKLLKTRPYIRFDRSAVLGILIDNWLESKRIRVTETMELDSPEAIASMVHANLGVSVVPNSAVKPQVSPQVKHFELGPDAPKRVLGLVYRQDQTKTRAIDAIFDALIGVVDREAGAQTTSSDLSSVSP